MRQGVFSALLSAGFSAGCNFAELQKMRAEGVLAKFAIARLYGHLGSIHTYIHTYTLFIHGRNISYKIILKK